jgi:hypothetical protein
MIMTRRAINTTNMVTRMAIAMLMNSDDHEVSTRGAGVVVVEAKQKTVYHFGNAFSVKNKKISKFCKNIHVQSLKGCENKRTCQA